LLADPSHLPQLWGWATSLIDSGPTSARLVTPQPSDDPQPGIRPPWHDQDSPNPFLSDGVLWLIELLGAHLATLTCLALPEAHWDVYRAHRRRSNDVFQHRTKLFGTSDPLGSDPSGMIYTAVIGHVYHRKPWSQRETLASLYDFMLRGAPGTSPHLRGCRCARCAAPRHQPRRFMWHRHILALWVNAPESARSSPRAFVQLRDSWQRDNVSATRTECPQTLCSSAWRLLESPGPGGQPGRAVTTIRQSPDSAEREALPVTWFDEVNRGLAD